MNNKNDPFFGLSHEEYLRKIGISNLRTLIVSEKWKISDPHRHGEAVEAVRRFDQSLLAASSIKREAREEETLAIAKEANKLAREANSIARLEAAAASRSARYAMYAAVIAAIGAITANKEKIYELICLFIN